MKKTIGLFLFFISCLNFSQAQSDQALSGHHISCKIKGTSDTIQLAYYYSDKKLLHSKAAANSKGEFEFKGDEILPCGMYMIVLPNQGYIEVLINDDQEFSIESDTSDLIGNMKVNGHEENELFYGYMKHTGPLRDEIQSKGAKYKEMSDTTTKKARSLYKEVVSIQNELKDYEENFQKEHGDLTIAKIFKTSRDVPTPAMKEIEDDKERNKARFNYYRAHFFDHIDFNDDCLVRTPILHQKITKFLDELTVQSPDSSIKAYDFILSKVGNDSPEMFKYLVMTLTRRSEKSKVMCFDAVRLHMYKKYYLNDPRVTWIKEETRKKIEREVALLKYNQCGDVAPDIIMSDTVGKMWRLHNISKDFVVAYFWSATCGHCKKATPKLQKLYDETKNIYNWEVFSVNIDRDLKEFKKFINKYQFDWISVFDTADENYFRQKYHVTSTPQIYILDKNKKIIAKRIDVGTIEPILQEETGIVPEGRAPEDLKKSDNVGEKKEEHGHQY